MPESPLPLRDIREEPSFEQSLKELGVTYPRLDEMMEGIVWRIAADPYSYPEVEGTPFRLARMSEWPGSRRILRVWLTVHDEKLVRLWKVDEIELPEDDEDE